MGWLSEAKAPNQLHFGHGRKQLLLLLLRALQAKSSARCEVQGGARDIAWVLHDRALKV